MACEDCGNPDGSTRLSNVLVCDRCYDNRIADYTGLPHLPDSPPSVLVHGPDGRDHRLRFKIWRALTGIEVELEEMRVPVGRGTGSPCSATMTPMSNTSSLGCGRWLSPTSGGSISNRPATERAGPLLDDEVAGQLVWNDEADDGKPHSVIVDGRTLSWEELGRALESYDGWRFRLRIENSIDDARSDTDFIELPRPAGSPEPTSG